MRSGFCTTCRSDEPGKSEPGDNQTGPRVARLGDVGRLNVGDAQVGKKAPVLMAPVGSPTEHALRPVRAKRQRLGEHNAAPGYADAMAKDPRHIARWHV